jgi:hydroxyacylglutathione hydrolase
VSAVLETIAIPAFQDNYIWLLSNGRQAIVVDPGDAAPVIAYLRQHRLRLYAILLTHHHLDHIGGLATLLNNDDTAHIPVYGPKDEAIIGVTHPLEEQDTICFAAFQVMISVLNVPGHTRGHIAFLVEDTSGGPARLFCGDTLFACGCGRLFEGTPQQMLASLDKLAALPETTRVYCAHEYTLSNIRFALACEPNNTALRQWRNDAHARRAGGAPTLPTTIGQEKQTNPFLRVDDPIIQQRLRARLDVCIADRLEAFSAMRKWKDSFIG